MGMNLLSWNSSCSDKGSSVNLFSPLTVPLGISSLPSIVQTCVNSARFGGEEGKVFFYYYYFLMFKTSQPSSCPHFCQNKSRPVENHRSKPPKSTRAWDRGAPTVALHQHPMGWGLKLVWGGCHIHSSFLKST